MTLPQIDDEKFWSLPVRLRLQNWPLIPPMRTNIVEETVTERIF